MGTDYVMNAQDSLGGLQVDRVRIQNIYDRKFIFDSFTIKHVFDFYKLYIQDSI
ncbi:hypothetical protein CPJCM30710_25070 [Clostridium polyendosporum]|uniref:Uncharacterized protein n=1 Tax=Clostridium polyendosporum TaxID=69208 RepID=A0A919S0R9_9CLOT|nr:hypothetical protein CPJCM30710_25070 [Clostridium polyendosporum]